MTTSVYNGLVAEAPYKSYIKRCRAKVHIMTLDPFSGEPVGVLLQGDYTKPDESCIYDVYTEKEDVYFRRANRKHFEIGDLVEYKRKDREETEEERLNKMTEDDFVVLLGQKFYSIQSVISKFTAVTPLTIMLEVARKEGKSEKITKLIEAKIAELQDEEFSTVTKE